VRGDGHPGGRGLARSLAPVFLVALAAAGPWGPAGALPWVPTEAAAQEPGAEGPFDRLVIRGATLIDGTGGPPVGPVDIVVEGGTITEVRRVSALDQARGVERPTGDRVIEAQGKWVMPGIIDAHTHMGHGDEISRDYIPRLWLAHGVTTVRTFTTGPPDPAIEIARAQDAGETVLAPRVLLYRFWRGDDPRLWSPEGTRELVRAWAAEGLYRGVKVSGKPGLLPDILRALGQETEAQGMGLAVHIGGDGVAPMDAVEVVKAGASTIEHHYGLAESSFEGHTVQHLEPDFDYADELKRFRASARVWDEWNRERLYGPVTDTILDASVHGRFTMVPTISVYEDQTDLARARNLPWLEDYAHPVLMERWQPNPEVHGSFFFEWTSGDEQAWGRLYLRWLPWLDHFKDRGGHVAVGSDTGTSYHLYGFGTVRELELLQRAGFLPAEVVRSATLESARAVGLEGSTGVVRPGYDADLLVLEMNPLEDFKVLYGTGVERVDPETGASTRLHGLEYTIVDGRVIDARAMLDEVARIVEEAKRR